MGRPVLIEPLRRRKAVDPGPARGGGDERHEGISPQVDTRGFQVLSCGGRGPPRPPLLGGLDVLTGQEISFFIFYLAPVSYVTWYGGRWPGVFVSLLSASAWLAADFLSGGAPLHPFVPLWNMAFRLSFFMMITFLLSELLKAHHVPAAQVSSKLLLELVADLYRLHEAARGKTALVAAESDKALISRVLGNMVKNALEGSEPVGTVTIGSRKNGVKVNSGSTTEGSSRWRSRRGYSNTPSPPSRRGEASEPTA